MIELSNVLPRLCMSPLGLRSSARAIADPAGGRGFSRPLQGCRVLLVEDDVFVGLDIAHLLTEMGAEVFGPARSLASAEAMARECNPEFAVLDVNLEGELTFGLAAELIGREVPTIFVTAYAADEFLFPAEVKEIPRLAKPIHHHALLMAINRML